MQQKPVFVAEERFPYFYTVLMPIETPQATQEMRNSRKNKVQSLHERFSHIYPVEFKPHKEVCDKSEKYRYRKRQKITPYRYPYVKRKHIHAYK